MCAFIQIDDDVYVNTAQITSIVFGEHKYTYEPEAYVTIGSKVYTVNHVFLGAIRETLRILVPESEEPEDVR